MALIHQWLFDEGSGATAYDNVGTNNGSLVYGNSATAGDGSTNGPIWATQDNVPCLYFDGNDDFVCTGTQYTNPTTYTLTAWFKTGTASGQKIIGFEQNQCATLTTQNYDRVIYVGTDGRLIYGVYQPSVGPIYCASSGTVTDSTWHLAAISQGGTPTMQLFLDPTSPTCAAVCSQNVAPNTSYSGYWKIGGRDFTTYGYAWAYTTQSKAAFTGYLADVRVYDTALSGSDLCTIYADGPPTAAASRGGHIYVFSGGIA